MDNGFEDEMKGIVNKLKSENSRQNEEEDEEEKNSLSLCPFQSVLFSATMVLFQFFNFPDFSFYMLVCVFLGNRQQNWKI